MPKIPISDVLGLNIDGKLKPGAKLPAVLGQFLRFQALPLDQTPLDQASLALNFEQPLDMPSGNLQLRIAAGLSGKLAVIRAGKRVIDASDPFSGIAVRDGEIYLAVVLDFAPAAGLSASIGPAGFGLDLNRDFSIKCYHRFSSDGQGFPTFGSALAQTFSAFFIPDHPDNLRQLPPGAILAIRGTGTLTVSGDVSFAMPVESLASIAFSGTTLLQVKPAASISVNASVAIEGEYDVRLRRLDSAAVELGLYNMKSRNLSVGVAAQAGLSAKAGGYDLLEKVIGALSSQPAVDGEDFRKALPGEDGPAKDRRISGFQSSLQGAISTKLQASLNLAFSKFHSDEALWLFQIDPEKATSDAANAALRSALVGNFTALTAGPALLPAGIGQLENVLTRTDVGKQTLRINLLGLLNTLSVTTITQVATIERNAAGDITLITDSANASRLNALLLNTGQDTKRLRKVMSENFLIEAAYQATSLGVLPPEFRSKHTYLEIHENTGRDEMKNNLDVPRVLGVIIPAEAERRLGTERQFGRTTLYTELSYTSDAVRSIFLDAAGKVRTVEDYETFGRAALGALLAGDENQELRMRYAELTMAGNELWKRMTQIGNVAAFGELFGVTNASADPRVAAAGSDYLAIVDWAGAMSGAATAVFDIERELADSAVTANDDKLAGLRQTLKKRLTGVLKKTGAHFGDPLGMIMVYLASGQNAAKTVLMTGDRIEPLEIGAAANSAGRVAG